MTTKMRKTMRCITVMFLTLPCLFMFVNCAQPEAFGELSLCLSAGGVSLRGGARSVEPVSGDTTITYITVGGYSDEGGSIKDQTFSINGSLKIKGLSVGTWHISVTGLNDDKLQITEKSVDDKVVIKSGKSTVASFNLQYLKEGTGSYSVTVTWPSEGGWFSGIVLDLGPTTQVSATPEKKDVRTVFSKANVPVGSYDVGLTFTNGSGTKVELPMMDTAKIYNALASNGTIELTEYDLVPVSNPVISIAGQKTVSISCGTEGAAVYYTIDGTDPADSSTRQLYSTPFDVSDASATIWAVGSRAGYRDSDAAGKKMDGSNPDGGIVIEVPGTIDNLSVSQGSGYTFAATYTEDGNGAKTIRWYMDGKLQDDTDDDDNFTYGGTLSEGRHQVTVKVTKSDVTYASSLRFSVDSGGIIIEVPGTIDDLSITQKSGTVFSASYTETGDGAKSVRWYMDGELQDDTDDDDNFTYGGTLSEGRHQVTVKVTKGEKTYAASFRFSSNTGGGGVVISVPGTISALALTQDSDVVFSASYTETGDGAKSVRWYMDGELQDDSDNNDNFTYGGTLSGGRHQVTIEITKGEKTYAASLRFAVYCLGAAGPAGGIIVEVNPNSESDGWTYLEAVPIDESSASTWSEAVLLCAQASYNGYEDWVLPTRSELEAIYGQRSSFDGFAASWYWSSDEDDTGNKAWQINFGSGVAGFYTKSAPNHVRAVRMF